MSHKDQIYLYPNNLKIWNDTSQMIQIALIFLFLGTAWASHLVKWDNGRVAEMIDAYWLDSSYEIEHRKKLAAFMNKAIFPKNRVLEIGCGSGLVYNELVPAVLPNSHYWGVDISEAMLAIAKKRFPDGNFTKDNLFSLSFTDNSFEVTAAFEVFGHIEEIETAIQEMFRVASRSMIFTVWNGLETKVENEVVGDTVFIRTTFSEKSVLKAIDQALRSRTYRVESHPLSESITAFIVYKL